MSSDRSAPRHSVLPLRTLVLLAALLSGCYDASPSNPPEIVVAQLVRLLQDPTPDVRRTAALSLGKIGRPEAAAALVTPLSDADAQVRRDSAWALGNLGEAAAETAGPALAAALSDPDAGVSAAAAPALGRVGTPPSVLQSVLHLAQTGPVTSRLAAIQALGWLEAPESFPVLMRSVGESDPAIRQAAIAALGELGDGRAVPALIDRLRHDPDPGVRTEAAFRLGKLGGAAAVPALQTATRDIDPRVRRWASAALDAVEEDELAEDAVVSAPPTSPRRPAPSGGNERRGAGR